MINEDLAKQKYSDLPMQSIQEAQPQKKRRNKRHEYKKSRHFKSCNDQASKPISPSIFFVVSKSKKLSKKKQLCNNKKSTSIKKVNLTDVFKTVMARKNGLNDINSLKIDTKNLHSRGLCSPKITEYTIDGRPSMLLSPSTMMKNRRRIKSPDQRIKLKIEEERSFTAKGCKRVKRVENIRSLNKEPDVANFSEKELYTQFVPRGNRKSMT
ncbi:unnamed protein product [Moneuplotes crassus]|uniref:Uncharacterized protein n=1 Tax=Euplotes crassus TaxID=5936 RepID=A0AAD1U7U2_EUPCR|nr:unnamed protein product [Moneuplotes crassus]